MDEPEEFECTVTAPVNIALVKYWGKKDQLRVVQLINKVNLLIMRQNSFVCLTCYLSYELIHRNLVFGIICCCEDVKLRRKLYFWLKKRNNLSSKGAFA